MVYESGGCAVASFIPSERWATFSVKDHTDTRALVADLVMYDRLVFPFPSDDMTREWDRNNSVTSPFLCPGIGIPQSCAETSWNVGT
jgi:hypothetical protein